MNDKQMDTLVRMFEHEIDGLSQYTGHESDLSASLQEQWLRNRIEGFLVNVQGGNHWWCRYPSLMAFMVRIIALYPLTESARRFHKTMAVQLLCCSKCCDSAGKHRHEMARDTR